MTNLHAASRAKTSTLLAGAGQRTERATVVTTRIKLKEEKNEMYISVEQ